mgnify:CR=1 FL=1
MSWVPEWELVVRLRSPLPMGSDIYIKGEYMDTNIVMDFEKTVQYIMDKTGLSEEIIQSVLDTETQYMI